MDDSLGQRLREARQKAGLRQADVARALGVQPTLVSKWEHGEQEPRPSYLRRIAELTRVSVDWLIGLEGGVPASVAPPSASGKLGQGPLDIRRLLRSPDSVVYYGGRPLSDEVKERLVTILDSALELSALVPAAPAQGADVESALHLLTALLRAQGRDMGDEEAAADGEA